MLARWGWLLATGLLGGLAIAWVLSGVAVSASSSFTVRSLGPDQTPYSAARLTLTYARLIPEDPEIIASMSRETGLAPDYIEDRFTMIAQPDTNVLFARFTGGDESTALSALQSLPNAIAKADDGAGTQLATTVKPVSRPVIFGGFSKGKALLLGALSGFAIAAAIALTLERRRPRVDRLDQLRTILPMPVSLATASRFVMRNEASKRAQAETEVLLPVDWVPRGSLVERNMLAILPAGFDAAGDGQATDPIALAVRKGTPAKEVERRLKEIDLSGLVVAAAFLTPRNLMKAGTR
jgi:hypothetical protein